MADELAEWAARHGLTADQARQIRDNPKAVTTGPDGTYGVGGATFRQGGSRWDAIRDNLVPWWAKGETPGYARVPETPQTRKAFDDWLKGGGRGKGPPAPGTLRPGWQALGALDVASSLPLGGGEGAAAKPVLGMFFAAPAGVRTAAARMLKEGWSAVDVWRRLGAFQGAEGLWRIERFSPRDVRLNFKRGQQATPIGQALDAPHIFEAHPEFGQTPLGWGTEKGAGSAAEYRSHYSGQTPAEAKVGLNPSRKGNSREEDVLHELQHGIQQRSGFSAEYPILDQTARQSIENEIRRDIIASRKAAGVPDPETVGPWYDETIRERAEWEIYWRSANEVEARNAARREMVYGSIRREQGEAAAQQWAQELPPWQTESIARDRQLIGPRGPEPAGGYVGPGGEPVPALQGGLFEPAAPPLVIQSRPASPAGSVFMDGQPVGHIVIR